MKKKTKAKPQKNQVMQEPAAECNSCERGIEIRFFSSFQAMNEADIQEMAALSPQESLQQATALIMSLYPKEVKKKFSDFTIHFK